MEEGQGPDPLLSGDKYRTYIRQNLYRPRGGRIHLVELERKPAQPVQVLRNSFDLFRRANLLRDLVCFEATGSSVEELFQLEHKSGVDSRKGAAASGFPGLAPAGYTR